MQLKPIKDQVVVVFGASSGIGREAALQFARRGARVVVAARSQEGLDSLVEEIRAEGGEATAVVADACHFDQVKAVADGTVERYGRLDTWAHLAAVSIYAPFERTTPEEFRQIVETNLLGQVHGAMAALPHLKREGRGALLHVSSVEARRSLPYQSAYAASKHGIEGFLDALRLELLHEGHQISVTNILPASFNTPLFSKARTRLGVKPKGLPPIYDPRLVAAALLDAAEHRRRDVIVGDAGRVIDFAQRLSPALVDSLLLATGFSGQRSAEPRSETAPDNLEAPIAGYDRVDGDFQREVQPSLGEWLGRNPAATLTLGGVALGAAALFAVRAVARRS